MNSFDDLQTKVFQLVAQGERQEALALINACAGPRNAGQQTRASFWQACLYAQLEQTGEALNALRSILDRGAWYAPGALERDADLAPLRSLPEFQSIVNAFRQRLEAESRDVRPLLELGPPDTQQRSLVLALHGNNGSLQETRPRWNDLQHQGWLVGLMQSGQLSGPNAYTWESVEQTLDEVCAHLARIDVSSRPWLAGFSRGGLWALRFALTGEVPAAGALVVAPSVPAPGRRGQWLPEVAVRVPVAVVVGSRDSMAGNIEAFVAELSREGIPVRICRHDGGHDYPEAWNSVRDEALQWLQQVDRAAFTGTTGAQG